MGGGSAEIFLVEQSIFKIVRAMQFFLVAQFSGKKMYTWQKWKFSVSGE